MVDSRRTLLLVAAILLAFCWLLPNHTAPWLTFHANAWMALVLLVLAFVLAWRTSAPFSLDMTTLFYAAVALIPAIHYASGLVLSFGYAWVHALHLFGAVAAMCLGYNWQKNSRKKP